MTTETAGGGGELTGIDARQEQAVRGCVEENESDVRFSIIIPTYERRDLVRRMVAALADQTHDDFEVIVVVDGSTDGTAAALRELGFSFPLSVLEQTNLGAAAARNAGVAAAGGELFLFL